MVHVIRKAAKQGHAIPSHAYNPVGPFNPELLAHAPIKYPDQTPWDDEPDLFLCRACEAVLREDQLDGHTCDEEDEL